MIHIGREDEGILCITIKGEPSESDDGDTWLAPKGLLKGAYATT